MKKQIQKASAKTIWVVEGFGSENPRKFAVGPKETVGDLIDEYAKKLDISASEIELSTDTNRLTNRKDRLVDVLDDGETVNVIPRAKAGVN